MLDAFDDGVRQITQLPQAWHPLGDGVRRFRLRRFPYGIVYQVQAEDITIVAFAHHKRQPLYWRDRLSKE